VVDRVQTPNWQLAVVFNLHPFHELGCDSDWGSISHLVERQTPLVALAIPWSFSDRVAAVYRSRELGKEESETELSAKQEASGFTAGILIPIRHNSPQPSPLCHSPKFP